MSMIRYRLFCIVYSTITRLADFNIGAEFKSKKKSPNKTIYTIAKNRE